MSNKVITPYKRSEKYQGDYLTIGPTGVYFSSMISNQVRCRPERDICIVRMETGESKPSKVRFHIMDPGDASTPDPRSEGHFELKHHKSAKALRINSTYVVRHLIELIGPDTFGRHEAAVTDRGRTIEIDLDRES